MFCNIAKGFLVLGQDRLFYEHQAEWLELLCEGLGHRLLTTTVEIDANLGIDLDFVPTFAT